MNIEEDELLEITKVTLPWYMAPVYFTGYYLRRFFDMMRKLCQKLK